LVKNGYVSKTLRTIQIGTKSSGEWVGEDLLIMDDVINNTYEYTAIAVTKLETYMINYSDMMKIPSSSREAMENVAKMRK